MFEGYDQVMLMHIYVYYSLFPTRLPYSSTNSKSNGSTVTGVKFEINLVLNRLSEMLSITLG